MHVRECFPIKSKTGGLETKKYPGNSCQKMILSKIQLSFLAFKMIKTDFI